MMDHNPEARKKLAYIVDRIAELKEQIKEQNDEIKELCVEAVEKCGVQAKVVKQLAKEKSWNEIERMAQRQLEEELDQCRDALGLLADLPLGEHAQERTRKKVAKKPTHAAANA